MGTNDSGLLYELVPRAALQDLEYLAALAAAEARVTDWDRYEAQLPQDGFGLLGLCCRACLNGPCRVSPFGRPGEATERAKRGVCGFGAEEMSLAYLAQTIGRGIAAIAASAGSDPATADLFRIAGSLLASVRPGQGSAQDLAHAVHSAAREAAGRLADIGRQQPVPEPGADAPVGLGHLRPGVPRALLNGRSWSGAQALSPILDAAAQRSVQLCASSAVPGAYEAGISVVIDAPSVPMLAQSRLVDVVIEDLPAALAALDKCLSQSGSRQDLPRHEAGGPPRAGRMPVWSGSPAGLFIAGSSKVRAAMGRGGYHQALARDARQHDLEVTGLGDGAYYLSPLAAELGIRAASLSRALPVLLRSQAEGGGDSGAPVLAAFPEPALPEELAAAFALAASGIGVFLGGELPLAPGAATHVEQAFDGALKLDLGTSLPPGAPVERERLVAAAAWLAGAVHERGASRQ